MNYRMLSHLLGVILFIEAAFMCIPLIVAAIYGEALSPFIYTILILLLVSFPLVLMRPKDKRIYAKEGFICVALSWILMSLFGALPFLFSGAIPSYIDCVFETASGFSTTGASILTSVEDLPKGILFWRSFTHWIGGMGVLVFMLAVLPLQGNAIHLMRAEVPGPTKEKILPKLRSTAKLLYIIYIVLTVAQIISLILCGLSLYDSSVTAFATAGTGGFSVNNASIAGYANPAVEWVCGIFMFIFGINFNIFFLILLGKIKSIFKSEELRWYFAIVAASIIVIALNTSHLYSSFTETLRHSFFQVTTISSTTGFSTVDYNTWPQLSRMILFILSFIGACAGSTAGGIKVSRIIILIKNSLRQIKSMVHPKSVNCVRIDKEAVGEETVKSASTYFILYMMICAVSVLVLSIDNLSFETNISAVVACINNIGPGFDAVGPMGNYSNFSDLSTVVLTLDMLIGRLEIMPIIVLFSPMTWKR